MHSSLEFKSHIYYLFVCRIVACLSSFRSGVIVAKFDDSLHIQPPQVRDARTHKRIKVGTVHPPAMYSSIANTSDTIFNNNSIKMDELINFQVLEGLPVCTTKINLDCIELRELFNFTVEWNSRIVKDT